MLSRVAIAVTLLGLMSIPVAAATCRKPDALPGVSGAPRSAAKPVKSQAKASPDCDTKLSDTKGVLDTKGGIGTAGTPQRNGAFKFGDTEIRVNGRVRVESGYGR